MNTNHRIVLEDFDSDIANASETPENRSIRAQLRLSSDWIVLGKSVRRHDQDYSDEHPDIPEVVESSDLGGEADAPGISIIHIATRPKPAYRCPCCGGSCSIICYETRKYRHVDDIGYKCYLRVRLPKFKCQACGGTPQKRFPAAWPRVSYTRAFARSVMAVLSTSSRSATAAELRTTVDVVNSILDHVIEDAIVNQDLSGVTGVYVDETQFGSGQDYISVFCDQRHRVIFVCKGNGKDALSLFLDHLVVQGGSPEAVRFFSADMSASYEAGILENFPNATLVWDRFHLAKSINEALNDVRKRTLSRMKDEPLKLVKYTVLHRRGRMPRTHVERLRGIRLRCPELALAFDMKETLLEIIKVPDPASMERSLRTWAEWVISSGPKEFVPKAKRFLEKMDRILAWTRFPVSNSVSEGVNKNIQDIRRQACGYTNHRNFFNMILFRQGGLTLRF